MKNESLKAEICNMRKNKLDGFIVLKHLNLWNGCSRSETSFKTYTHLLQYEILEKLVTFISIFQAGLFHYL